MRIEEPLRILCVKTDLSIAEIGRRLNRTPQAFSQKIKRGKITIDDLQDIAMVTGCEVECSFNFPDGEKIAIK